MGAELESKLKSLDVFTNPALEIKLKETISQIYRDIQATSPGAQRRQSIL
jgi:hypothetical protein